MIVHELWQHTDGTLGVKPIPALREALQTANTLKWTPLNGAWRLRGEGASVESPHGYADLLSLNEVPSVCRFEASFTFTPGTDRIGLVMQADESFAKGYYFYFEPQRQRVSFKGPLRMHEQGGWTFPYDVELERPLRLVPNEPCRIALFVDHSIMTLYVNDDIALTVRNYDLYARKIGLAVSDGSANFEALRLFTC